MAFTTTAVAQHATILHQDMAPLVEKVVLPSTAEASFTVCTEEDGKLVFKQVDEVTALLQRLDQDLHAPPPPQQMQQKMPVSGDEIQRKMASMTQEEKLAYAQQVAQEMGGVQTSMVPESETVSQGLGKILDLLREDDDAQQHVAVTLGNLNQSYQDKQKKNESRLTEMIKTCPKGKGDGEASPDFDPACVSQKARENRKSAVLIADDYLAAVRSAMHDYVGTLKRDLASIDAIIASTHYGADIKNENVRQQYAQAQAREIDMLTTVYGWYRDVTVAAAETVRTERMSHP